MRHHLSIALLGLSFLSTGQTKKDYPIQAVPFTAVNVADHFWSPRLETNRTITIPASFEQCRITGRIRNFEMAAARSGKFCTVFSFDDTDIYKTIEGASYSLKIHPDKKLELFLDSLIALIAKAQEPDGYLFTERTIDPVHTSKRIGPERWVNERLHSHELYNAGHLYEAAYAHYIATGRRNFLEIAIKNANLIEATFGEQKRHVAPGHQVIELGLVKLYRATGDEKYLELARYFLDERGRIRYDSTSKDGFKNGAYWQDHKPVIQQDEAVGHAVRAVYMYSGMADVAALTGDQDYIAAVDRLWDNAVGKKMYVTGGIGAAGDGERFGENYELPNATAYCETCASIGNVFWNYRMFLLHGESKYIDVLERTLYNGLLSGVGMDGKTFFYTNSLQINDHFRHPDIELKRSAWFPCSCCPTNVTRIMPSIPGYVYAHRGNDVYVNLFVSSAAEIPLDEKKKLQLTQESNYPWEGNIKLGIQLNQKAKFNLRLRIPGWALGQPIPGDLYMFKDKANPMVVLKINGQPVAISMDKGYAVINREWKKNDVIELSLPMAVRKVIANPNVKDDEGRVALQRGPLIYCAEGVDNHGKTGNLILPENSSFADEFRSDLLNGVVTLKGEALAVTIAPDGTMVGTQKQPFVAIPYYAWAHRGQGEMNVWFPEKIKGVELLTK